MSKSSFVAYISLISLIAILSGCNKPPTFAELCSKTPEICEEFEEDSWCKSERISVGFANLAHRNNPEDLERFNQLISYEKYQKCMTHASKIEHIKFKEKQTMRINNVSKAKAKIKEISEVTKSSNLPELLYFHWSRYIDKDALKRFLELEKTQQLETAELQFKLATYYAKRDQNKTLRVLYHALELTDKDIPVNNEIFKSIATIFADKKKYKQVYIWSKILVTYSPEDEHINKLDLQDYAKSFDLNTEFLDDVALKTLKKILEGSFKAPRS